MSSEKRSLILQWQCDKSVSQIPVSDVLGQEKLLPGDKVKARYNSRLLPANILYIGGVEDMQQKMKELCPDPSDSTDSPKGRGHRTLKRKQLPSDFVSSDEDHILPTKKASMCNSQLQKRAKSAAGHDIIQQLLEQRTETNDRDQTLPQDTQDTEEELEEEELEVLSSDSVSQVSNLEDDDIQQQLQKKTKKLAEAYKRIEQLESLNQCLLKGLPDVVRQLQLLFQKNRDVTISLPKQKTVPSTPVRYKGKTSSLPSPMVLDEAKPDRCQIERDRNSEPDKVIEGESEILDSAIVSRALAGKTVGKVVCNLMRCMFTREEMATASVTGRSGGNGVKAKLDEAKVEEVIRLTMTKFPGSERSHIRAKMAEKLKDERKAFHSK